MTSPNTNTPKTHVLIIPYPAQGHMIPLLDLTHHIANTNLFTLTILTTPKNLHLVSPLIALFPDIVTPLVLPLPSVPGLPPGAENTKDLPPIAFRSMMHALSQLHEPLRLWFDSHPSPPVAVISDFFSGWTQRFASEVGIKRVVFSPSGGMAVAVIYWLWRSMPREETYKDKEVMFNDVPNCPKYPWWQISGVFRSYVEGEEVSEIIRDNFKGDMESWGLVMNTFSELESDYLDHFKCLMGHDRVWAVGPLAAPEDNVRPNGQDKRGGQSSVEVGRLLSWLDTCNDDEVVYVAFGTQAVLSRRQMEVIAVGLEKSGVNFIWSVRDPTKVQLVEGDHGTVPPGFEERVGDRGIVIKGWAPQVTILRHRAVGVFLTHCGWNSVLEGIAAGVELLAWPIGADQFSNATLLVDELKVAVRVCEGSTAVPEPAGLARVFAESVKRGRADRQRTVELRDSALKAVKVGGSSYKDLARLVKSLTDLNNCRTAHPV